MSEATPPDPSPNPVPAPSPLASPGPWDLVAEAYAADVVPMFEAFATQALDWAGVRGGMDVADVATGPGTLAVLAATRGARVSALDFSPNMIAALRARLAASDGLAIDAVVGDGMALPWRDASFDAGFSMFGLMFFPDRAAGFRGLRRVLRPGGRAVVSSWVELSELPLLRALYETFGAAMEGPPAPPRPMPLVDRASCREEMLGGGFSDVEVLEGRHTFEVSTTDELIEWTARSNAPIVLAKSRMGEAWGPVEARWRMLLSERIGSGPHEGTMIAHMICGTC